MGEDAGSFDLALCTSSFLLAVRKSWGHLWPASAKPLQQAHDPPFLAVAGGCIYNKECGVVTWSCSAASRGREHARSVSRGTGCAAAFRHTRPVSAS
jgi:hypothetical protein